MLNYPCIDPIVFPNWLPRISYINDLLCEYILCHAERENRRVRPSVRAATTAKMNKRKSSLGVLKWDSLPDPGPRFQLGDRLGAGVNADVYEAKDLQEGE
jgi:hypothetical protein